MMTMTPRPTKPARTPTPDTSKELRIRKISAGTVVDHITAGYALAVLQILGITGAGGEVVSIAMNVQSQKLGKKDVIKVEGKELTSEEINRIAMVAPNATINIIRDYEVYQKQRITVPDHVEGIVRCANPSCITNRERGIASRFTVVERTPVTLRCKYCQRVTGHDNIIAQLLGKCQPLTPQ
jgi:aspartate carbamoyltransferase regulatory subunit